VTHALRARAACGLAVPGSVITGASAAALWGVDLVSPEDEVELTVPPGRHAVRAAGLRVRRCHVADEHVVVRRWVRVTSPEATAVRLAGHLPLEDAVVTVDRLIATRGLDLQNIRALAGRQWAPAPRAPAPPAALADGLTESPQETRLRLLIGRSGLPQPVAQYRVRHDGRVVARVDFAWPDRKVALEYDGLWHAEDGQFANDRARLNRLREAGWTVVFVTAADMYQPARLVARIAAALA
jgi:hypothetical protein